MKIKIMKHGLVKLVIFLGFQILIVDISQAQEKAEPKWFSCTEDKQCIVIDGGCGWTAVNHDYADAAEKYYRSMKPFIDCMPGGGYTESKPGIKCIKNQCQIANDHK